MTILDIHNPPDAPDYQQYRNRVLVLEAENEKRTRSLWVANAKLRQKIAEQRRAEKILQEHRNRLLALVNASPDVMVVLDERGICLEVFTSQRQLLATDPEMKIGRHVSEFLPGEQAQLMLEVLSRVLAEERLERFEYEIRVAKGTCWFEGRMVLLDRSSDNYRTVLLVSRDITDRKLAEDELSESEERHRALVASCPDGIVMCDLECRPVMANQVAAEYYGEASVDEILSEGLCSFDCIVPEDRARAMENAIKTIETGITRNNEYRFRRNNGETIPIEISAALIKDKNGSPKAFIGVLRDLSERKREEEERVKLQAKLLETQRLESLGLLAATIAHDYKNLLAGLYGHVDIALMNTPPRSPIVQSLHNIRLTADRLSEFTSQILSYSGGGEVAYATINISEIVAEMINLLHVAISKKIGLKPDLHPSLPAIQGDTGRIRQVVMNLITNAAEAIGDHAGTITIRTGMCQIDHGHVSPYSTDEYPQEGPHVFLEVTDTGCGIPQEYMEKIFDPFFTSKSSGRGLGLAAVRGIVRSHHGAIQVHTEENRGSTFMVLLPCLQNEN